MKDNTNMGNHQLNTMRNKRLVSIEPPTNARDYSGGLVIPAAASTSSRDPSGQNQHYYQNNHTPA